MKFNSSMKRDVLCKTICVGLLITAGQTMATPGDLGYRFIHNNIGVRDLTVNYGPVFAGAGAEYSSAANVSFFTSPIPGLNAPFTGDVAFSEANFGATGWAGIAIAYNQSSQPCADPVTGALTGNCTLTNGADFGWIRFNSYYNPNPTLDIRNHLVRHEFGHILGLGHDTCSPSVSIMAPSASCSPTRTTLQSPEIGLLNAWY